MFADKVIKNAKIYTIDKCGEIVQSAAIKDGRFICVGSNKEVADYVGENTEVIDAEGKTVLPGLIESHVHVPGNGYNILYNINVFDARTDKETESIISEYIRKHPDREIYFGRGFKTAVFPGIEASKGPRKERLDKICNNKPIVIIDEGGHVNWLNSKAFEISGITEDTEDVAGGVIEKDNVTGALWGTLKDEARLLGPERQYTKEEKMEAYEWFQNFYVSLGFTAIAAQRQPACTDPIPMVDIVHEFEKQGRLILHVSAAREIKVTEDEQLQFEHLEEMRDYFANQESNICVNTAKFFIDGTVEGVSAFLSEPYTEAAGKGSNYYGEFLWNFDRMKKAFAETLKRGFNIHVHAVGDEGVTKAIDAFEYAQSLYPGDHRNCITHLQIVKDEDIVRMGKMNIIAGLNSFWHFKDPTVFFNVEVRFLGADRANKEYPAKSFRDAGCLITCSADYPVTPYPNPFQAIEVGVTRNLFDAQYFDEERIDDIDDEKWLLGKEERLSVLDMVKAYTINAAYATHREKEMGSIEAGKWADYIIIDRDIFEIAPLEIEDTKVLETVFKGETVYVSY